MQLLIPLALLVVAALALVVALSELVRMATDAAVRALPCLVMLLAIAVCFRAALRALLR